MNNWITTTLKEVSQKIITGPFGSQLHQSDYIDSGIAVIMPQNIEDRYVNYNSIAYISENDADRLSRYKAKPYDIVYSRRGDVEKHALIRDKDPESFCGTGCFLVRLNTSKVHPEFVSFYLNRPESRTWLRQHAVGSNMPNLNSEILNNVPICYPEKIETQKKLVEGISSLDLKINLNNTINAELEKLAKTLYNYWFVQFDFPNANGKPYRASGGKMEYNEVLKREIPNGWEVKRFSDLATITTGKEDANFSTPKGKYNFFTCGREILRCDTPAFNGKAVLLAGNGDFNVKHYSGEFNAYQRTYVLIPKQSAYYAAMYIAANDKVAELKKGAYGSIVKFITMGDVENIALPICDVYISLFEKLNDIITKIELLEQENSTLIELRDFLLPLLMNGQVRVGEK